MSIGTIVDGVIESVVDVVVVDILAVDSVLAVDARGAWR